MINMFDHIPLLKSMMDSKWLRNEVITNNIANVDTPGFKRSDVSFEELLESNLERNRLKLNTTHKGHKSNLLSSSIKPKVYSQRYRTTRNDQNNVDIDKEMVEIAKNALSYNILAEQAQKKFQLLKTAISEGRK